MSSALVRQALEFVDQEEGSKHRKRRAGRRASGQERSQHPYKPKHKPAESKPQPSIEDNVRKLLALSKPAADTSTTKKIIERAVKRKPLLEKIEVKKEEEKSILFPEEPHSKFEREYFCS